MDSIEIKTFSLGELLTNAYLVINKETKNCFIVDAPKGIGVVERFIKENGYKLLYLILTHGHIDHIGGLGELECPFYIHSKDRLRLLDSFNRI